MKAEANIREYNDLDKNYRRSQMLANGVQVDSFVQIGSEKFVDYQKELFEEFLANFLNQAANSELTENEIELLAETELKKLNDSLLSFAEKLHDMPVFDIRGYFQLFVDEKIKIWLIGNSSLMIFRENRLYTSLENPFEENAKIDTFTDFIGGETLQGDVYLYAGMRLADALDQNDVEEMQALLEEQNVAVLIDALDAVLSSRVDKSEIWFLSTFSLGGISLETLRVRPKWKLTSFASQIGAKYMAKLRGAVDLGVLRGRTQGYLKLTSNYYLIAGVLGLLVVVLGYAVLSQFSVSSQVATYTTGSGTKQTITLAQLKQDIEAFKQLNASSDEKSLQYQEILAKFQQIQSQGIWQEDIKNLKKVLEDSYEQGYNIASITSFSQFDNASLGKKSEVLTLSADELAKIGTPLSLAVGAQSNVAGSKWALMGIVNDSTRGTLVAYDGSSDVKECTLSISKKGLVCYGTWGNLFYVSKTGVESMESSDGSWATANLGGVLTYNKNLYLFQKNPNNFASVILTRYTNLAGSEAQYKWGQNYSLLAGSGVNLPSLNGFVVDQTFLAWGGGKLYQFWRPEGQITKLDHREIPMIGGDKVVAKYSDNVKVLASETSPYVALFDRDNQTMTVYESSPIKTNANHKTSFKLYYLLRFKFDLSKSSDRIVDMTIPTSTADKPELHVLTTKGLYKINLYESIDAVKSHQTVTTQ